MKRKRRPPTKKQAKAARLERLRREIVAWLSTAKGVIDTLYGQALEMSEELADDPRSPLGKFIRRAEMVRVANMLDVAGCTISDVVFPVNVKLPNPMKVLRN